MREIYYIMNFNYYYYYYFIKSITTQNIEIIIVNNQISTAYFDIDIYGGEDMQDN